MDPHPAQQKLELLTASNLFDPERDALYGYDEEYQRQINQSRPWASDPRYFKYVRISALALLKMVVHAHEGGSNEVMGLMQGYILSETFVVTDAFRLPVEGTETRVNAQDEANEYMVAYLQSCRDAGRPENAVGWYHSHPGYGCWLSGIDVATQQTHQMTGPFVAVVIDPQRTISSGRVEIGAFRTFPADYTLSKQDQEDEQDQSIPLGKAEDFGAHANRYYSLETSHYKSTLDTYLLDILWNKYWASTISQSPSDASRDYVTKQITDLSQKINKVTRGIETSGPRGGAAATKDQQLDKVVREGNRIAAEEEKGALSLDIKMKLFLRRSGDTKDKRQEKPAPEV
ncbi:COP9 signalosome complex subunit 5 [Penicillium argentinense]|uniref:COP9 signalosome complex subunit 5 n=1 Tax=Penicillium argentinense TaxID=1131581 RepID=A0A9W9FDW7_9EURO|nr:COP9 signalosome complex subunit 5 [Penicillium argentinense]KAJ5098137.1 COP9 signalosome complex subunit 5 [Penicillium argentinense]